VNLREGIETKAVPHPEGVPLTGGMMSVRKNKTTRKQKLYARAYKITTTGPYFSILIAAASLEVSIENAAPESK